MKPHPLPVESPTDFSVARNARRIVCLNPTRYLGNLLLAGGLLQDYARHCQAAGVDFLLVLDEAFEDLCREGFAGVHVLWYPRRRIAAAGPLGKLRLLAGFMKELRAFRADVAFNIEEDTTADRLTRWSGAAFRLGCSPARHRRGYDRVLAIDFAGRHRWDSFADVFAVLGFHAGARHYLDLRLEPLAASGLAGLPGDLQRKDRPWVVVHSGATKDYKKWPEEHFLATCRQLMAAGVQPILIGAGADDAARCERLAAGLAAVAAGTGIFPLNLCNRLSLRELAQFFRHCDAIVGNDSGPFHLATAQGLPGVVIFGPTEAGIWAPLGTTHRLLQRRDLCEPQCSRRGCHAVPAFRCLREIGPEEVLHALHAVAGVPAP